MQQPGACSPALTQVPVRHPPHLPGRGQARRDRGRRHPGGGHVQPEDPGHVRDRGNLPGLVPDNHHPGFELSF